MNTPLKRLKKSLKEKNIKNSDIAKKMCVVNSAISNLLAKENLSQRDILFFKHEYNINPDWLLNGTQPMYLQHKNRYTDDKQGRLKTTSMYHKVAENAF